MPYLLYILVLTPHMVSKQKRSKNGQKHRNRTRSSSAHTGRIKLRPIQRRCTRSLLQSKTSRLLQLTRKEQHARPRTPPLPWSIKRDLQHKQRDIIRQRTPPPYARWVRMVNPSPQY